MERFKIPANLSALSVSILRICTDFIPQVFSYIAEVQNCIPFFDVSFRERLCCIGWHNCSQNAGVLFAQDKRILETPNLTAMDFKLDIENFIRLFDAKVSELSIDYLFLDALLHAPSKGARPSEEEFFQFCFFCRCQDATAAMKRDFRSIHYMVKRRAESNLAPASVTELRLLGCQNRCLIARCKAKLGEDRTIRRLHLKLLYRLREDVQKLMTRFGTTNFTDFLEVGIGPYIQDIVTICNRLNETDKARTRGTHA